MRIIGIWIFSLFSFLSLFLLTSTDTHAKLLPRFQGSSGSSSSSSAAPVASSKTVAVSPRYLPGKSGLKVFFGSLQNATSVSYILTYETNGKAEGVSGSVKPSEGNTSRDLLFATCSSGVCNNHGKITNMRLEVTSKLKSGKTSIKRYRMRV